VIPAVDRQAVEERPQATLSRRVAITTAIAAGLSLTGALSLRASMRTTESAIPLVFGIAFAWAAVAAYLLHVRAEALDDGRLRLLAGGFGVAGLGLLLQAQAFLPGGGAARTTPDGVSTLYLIWHLAVLVAAGGALVAPRMSTRARITLATGGVVAALYAGWGPSLLPDLTAPNGGYTPLFRSVVASLAVLSLVVTMGWIRANRSRPNWAAMWVGASLALATCDLGVTAVSDARFSVVWWSSLTIRLAQFAVPAAGLLAGFVSLHRALFRHERSLMELLDEERRRAEEEFAAHRAAERRHEQTRARVRNVIESDLIGMVFQPIADLRSGEVVGVEALARFACEPFSPPDVWFREAAEVGLGTELELLAVRKALAEFRNVPERAFLALNVSPDVLTAPSFASALDGVPLNRVVLELTEHAQVRDYDVLRDALRGFRSRGVRLAIDDAGAGFASMRHIVRLSPDIIKLDVTLTRDIDVDPVRNALASSLILFARDIGATIVAEGIETWREVEALRALGVPHGQGHHLAWPAPLPLPEMVRQRTAISA
jgi:EAL domain-containing protein (putative c-di-GMP-specific phosphodiesterase class I)